MPTVFIRCVLFLSSYFPLMLIFGILIFAKQPIIAEILVAFGLSCVIGTWGYLRWSRRHLQGWNEKVIDFQQRDADVMSYIASYLVPFITFPLDYLQQVIALVVFMLVLLIVYVNTNMIYINPMLNLAGYHLYEINIEHSRRKHYYIARKHLIRDEMIHFVHLSDDIFLEK